MRSISRSCHAVFVAHGGRWVRGAISTDGVGIRNMHFWHSLVKRLGSGPRWIWSRYSRTSAVGLLMIVPLAVFTTLLATVRASPDPAERPAPLTTTMPSTALRTGDARRGEYIATVSGCVECHTVRLADGVRLDRSVLLAGGVPIPGPWGVSRSANVSAIVPAVDDLTLEMMIRGQLRFLYPMPTEDFNTMAAQDMADLIRYLRTVPPTEHVSPPPEYNPAFTPPPRNVPIPFPIIAPSGPTAARGRYLVTQGGCGHCHTPRTDLGTPDQSRLLTGSGFLYPGPNGTVFQAPNLTPDPTTGLGTWTDAQIVAALREGRAPDGHQLNPVMPYASAFYAFTDDDVAAVVRHLRELQPVSNPLPANPTWAPAP
jgi:mono/diheme cytochrome c family protein